MRSRKFIAFWIQIAVFCAALNVLRSEPIWAAFLGVNAEYTAEAVEFASARLETVASPTAPAAASPSAAPVLGSARPATAAAPAAPQSTAKSTGIIRGSVLDSDGEAVEFVAVGVVNLSQSIGTVTDAKGQFELRVPIGVELSLRFSHASYESATRKITLFSAGEVKNIQQRLKSKEIKLSEVSVSGQRSREGFVNIDPMIGRKMVGITGGVEAVIKSLPGVNSNNELSSQYSVRGGNFDENLIYVNDIEIYRPLLTRSGEQEGMSFINPDLVSSVLFSGGGFDAKYGDKMASVLDIKYKTPTKFGGSLGLNFMGANMHLEGVDKKKKFTYLLGLRHKATQYVLKALDRKGNYKPSFTDFQGYFTYKLDDRNEFSLLGNISYNIYKFLPSTQETKLGANGEQLMFTVAFEGQERDVFETYFSAFTWKNKTSDRLQNSLTFNFFNTIEEEKYDIEGAYLLSSVEDFSGVSDFADQGEILGVGSFLNHARNYLNAIVTSLDYKALYEINSASHLQWGAKYQYEDIIDRINEWDLEDSASYIIPNVWDNAPGEDVWINPPVFKHWYRSNNKTTSHRLNAFAQGTYDFNSNGLFLLNAGLRMSFWSLNKEFLASPRMNFSYHPRWKTQTSFRLALGHYAQTPFYKEIRDPYGNINREVKAQQSIHLVLGSDLFFKLWDRPFKFSSEAYYKYLYRVNPYEVDNVRIRYMAANTATAYATGLDLRLNGEFVSGAESWLSVSLMKTSENIAYTKEEAEIYHTGFVPRPSDQLFSINLYFQDYLTRNKNIKVYLNGVFATGLPSGNMDRLIEPEKMSWRSSERLPSYKRVDIGMAFLLKGEKRKFGPKNPLTYIKNIWIGVEVFNLFQMNNTISYTWINTFNGSSYAIPNRLTPLQVNLKLNVDF